MGLFSFIAEKREQQILERARPHVGDDEEVVSWVRARDPERRSRKGILFVTGQRVIVAWSTKAEARHISWDDVRGWGVDKEVTGGPVVCIEGKRGDLTLVQIVVETRAMARAAASFIGILADVAPRSDRSSIEHGNGSFVPKALSDLDHHKKTPAEMVRRVALTLLGAGLIVLGVAIVPLPGPWSFLLNIAGLAVLAREYDWADDLLEWTKDRFEAAKKKVAERKRRRGA